MKIWILLILVIAPGVWSGEWSVTSESQCAVKGTSVVIKCSYNYPSYYRVNSVTWSKLRYVNNNPKLYIVSSVSSSHFSPSASQNRFEYVGDFSGNCDLRIKNVQPSDAGSYAFRFVTSGDSWRSKTYARLSVGGLTTVIQPSTVTEGHNVSLSCVLTVCQTPTRVVWFKDGQYAANTHFQASREDAGSYYCAVLGQETATSAPVTLKVRYAPKEVTLLVRPSGDVVQGGSVTLTCSSDANPRVTESGYSLYKNGEFISSGQRYIISDIQSNHSGLYHCQAGNSVSWKGIDLINSTEIYLDVQYRPINITVSVDPPQVTEGSSVNLTCSSVANPAADGYTWYKETYFPSSNSSSTQQVGSGQVLSLSPVQVSHTGLYICQARNSWGENNSTEVLLTMQAQKHGSQPLSISVGLGILCFVGFAIALLLLWRKQNKHPEKKTMINTSPSGRGLRFSASDDQFDPVYANISTSPSSPALVPAHSSQEDEIIYSPVTIKPRDNHASFSRSKPKEDHESVIYAVVTSSSKS